MRSTLICTLLVFATSIMFGQLPNWTVNSNNFQNSMTAIITISDECTPSADPGDMVAAFDINGQIRGVESTDVNNQAFLTIYSMGAGEKIFFKVYDAGTDMVYNIYDVTVTFVSDGEIGTPPDPPLILNFDSAPTGVNAGPDQEVFNSTTTTLAATGAGHWLIIFGAQGSVANVNSPTSLFTGVIGSTYILAWTLDDTGGCIGETDEVQIILVIDEPEDNVRTCTDGLDNDGDGLTDCSDPNCGIPEVTNIATVDPTAVNCTTTQIDGSITVTGSGIDLYSLNNGVTTQTSNVFSNLDAGVYDVWMQNNLVGCTTTVSSVELINNYDPLEGVTPIEIIGPEILCPNSDNIHYSLSSIPPLGSLSWTYSGTGVIINASGFTASIEIGVLPTSGQLMAVLTEECGSLSHAIDITIASPLACAVASCPKNAVLTNAIINVPGAPQVYRTKFDLKINAQLAAKNYEFSAGNSVEFQNGFSHGQGNAMFVEMRDCVNVFQD